MKTGVDHRPTAGDGHFGYKKSP